MAQSKINDSKWLTIKEKLIDKVKQIEYVNSHLPPGENNLYPRGKVMIEIINAICRRASIAEIEHFLMKLMLTDNFVFDSMTPIMRTYLCCYHFAKELGYTELEEHCNRRSGNVDLEK